MPEEVNPLQTYKQHPIPQNVLGVEFKLVGELTLRQFLYVGGAVLLAYLIYNANLPSFFSYPLSLTVALLGLAAAFLPVQNQSFDQWLVHFIGALTSPTQRVWRKVPTPPDFFYFSYAPTEPVSLTRLPKDRTRLQEYLKTLKAPAAVSEKNELDVYEENFIKNLGLTPPPPSTGGLPPPVRPAYQPFTRPPRKRPNELNLATEISYAQGAIIAVPGEEQPHYIPSVSNVRVGRKLGSIVTTAEGAVPVQGEIEIRVPSKPEPTQEERIIPLSPQEKEAALKKQLEELETKMAQIKKEKPPARPPTYTVYTKTLPGSYLKARPTPPLATTSPVRGPLWEAEMERLRQENKGLQERLQKRERLAEQQTQAEEREERYRANFARLNEQNSRLQEEVTKAQAALEKMQAYTQEVSSKDLAFQKKLQEQGGKLRLLSQEKTATEEALRKLEEERHQQRREGSATTARAEELRERIEPPPPPPTAKLPSIVKDTPNVINGVVRNSRGELLEGAVVIVKDETGEPVRALKTNKVGQFAVSTPLPNGRYEVTVTYEGEVFAIMTVNVLDKVLEPLEFMSAPNNAGH